MKLVTLNLWGGRVGLSATLDFFRNHRDVDIFCLQEMWSVGTQSVIDTREEHSSVVVPDLLSQIQNVLPDHQFFFRPNYRDYFGLTTFVHRKLKVENEGQLFVYKDKGYEDSELIGKHARNLQYLNVDVGGKPVTIINFHGLWNGKGKTDCEERILQSERISNFVGHLKNPYVLAGDFNLRPETKSLKILTDHNMRNLIVDFQIKSTRSNFYQKLEKFADYILTSKEIDVLDFKVLPDEISDHLALQLTFGIEKSLNNA